MPEQTPTIGRIVHYVREEGVERPAIIVHVWPDNATPHAGMVQLQVFNDSDGGPANDGLANVTWETSVEHSEDPQPHTWHWPERA
jgi:hypothetical protein